jgi:hypothetical protein
MLARSSHTVFFVAFLATVLVACADTEGPASADDDIKSAAGEGQSCGGFVANAKHCKAGLVCIATGHPDLPGTCQKDDTAKEGESCGGTVAKPRQCASGLTCVMPTVPHAIGGTGTCEKDNKAKEGESCGGTVADPKECETGLACVMPTPHAIGGTGTCKRPAL